MLHKKKKKKNEKTNEVLEYKSMAKLDNNPPSARAPYIAKDMGNATPRFMRMTISVKYEYIFVLNKYEMAIFLFIYLLFEAFVQQREEIGGGGGGKKEKKKIYKIYIWIQGPIRCEGCHAYMNPHVKWIQSGRTWVCNICYINNECPTYYRCNIDGVGNRMDRMEKPELHRGSVDYVASKDTFCTLTKSFVIYIYMSLCPTTTVLLKRMRREQEQGMTTTIITITTIKINFITQNVRPMSLLLCIWIDFNPVYFFVIDVTANAYQRGLVELSVNSIRNCLRTFREQLKEYYPHDPNQDDSNNETASNPLDNDKTSSRQKLHQSKTPQVKLKVGFLTYDTKIHLHSVPDSKIHVISQVDDPFVALPASEILIDIYDDTLDEKTEEERYDKFDQLLERVPQIFAYNDLRNVEEKKFSGNEYNTTSTGATTTNSNNSNNNNSNNNNSNSNSNNSSSFLNTKMNQSCFGSALTAASQIIASFGGKIFAILTCLPNVGIGKLTHRENAEWFDTEKERDLFQPNGQHYESLMRQCVDSMTTVDIFACSTHVYLDLATVGVFPLPSPTLFDKLNFETNHNNCQMQRTFFFFFFFWIKKIRYASRRTGGQLYYYPNFYSQKDGLRFERDLLHDITRVTVFNCVLAIRASKGVEVVDYMGALTLSNHSEVAPSTVNSDWAFAVRMQIWEKLDERPFVAVQLAMLYSTIDGNGFIRVHTVSLPVVHKLADVYRCVDMDAVLNVSLKQAVSSLMVPMGDMASVAAAREGMCNGCVEILFTYRRYCAAGNAKKQLVLPESLKLLPLYTLGMIKCPMLAANVGSDERVFELSYAAV
ncbi:hypothetical protein RFI_14106 [Reticulomyxa filosa]|uniref:Uncharacterized protein n=1 Tax=Reticulomyxa filosa TaxID=46433 RepID=X6NCN2_RETFI|nr:hypothetical protein RFI_14106 [Reticulomyxa filosa]|eukprot:ETO23082.1 hypothetical protein RFI_14106 [Reticulomyxa filosa]